MNPEYGGNLESTKGDVSITGWTTRRVNSNVYLAVNEAEVDGEPQRWVFEVNLRGPLVRNVAEDPALETKYLELTWSR